MVFNLQNSIFNGEVAHIDESISVSDVAQGAFVCSRLFEDGGVHPFVGSRITAEHDVGGYVFLHTAAALYEAVASDTHSYLADNAVGEDCVAIHFDAATQNGVYAQHTAVFEVYVVAKMCMVHQAVIVADACAFFVFVSAGYDAVFADDVVVADGDMNGGAFFEVKALGHGSDDGVLEDTVVLTHLGARKDGCLWVDDAVVTDFGPCLNVGKGKDFNVLANLGSRFHDGLWADHIRIFLFRIVIKIFIGTCTRTRHLFYVGLCLVQIFASATECAVEVDHRLHAGVFGVDQCELGGE